MYLQFFTSVISVYILGAKTEKDWQDTVNGNVFKSSGRTWSTWDRPGRLIGRLVQVDSTPDRSPETDAINRTT
jgi:hypothetical protein